VTPYWLMFLLPSLGAVLGLGQHRQGRRRDQAFLVLLFIIFVMFIGLRDGTGGDFFNYQRNVEDIAYERFSTSIGHGDPAFTILAEFSNLLNFGIYGVNFACGLLFMIGLLRFVRDLPDPWLAIAAAVPYMIIVIAMGYIRQGVSIGFILIAIRNMDHRQFGWMTSNLLAALLFHIASICVVPIFMIALFRREPVVLIALTLVGMLAFFFVLRDRLTGLYAGYIASEYDSSGALVRLMMNAVPAAVFLAFRQRYPLNDTLKLFWTIVSVISLAMVPLLALSSSSTWIDRIGLFFSPIQLVVFGYITSVFAKHIKEQRIAAFLAILFYAVVLFIWLNYAVNAGYWLPYRWLLSPTPFP